MARSPLMLQQEAELARYGRNFLRSFGSRDDAGYEEAPSSGPPLQAAQAPGSGATDYLTRLRQLEPAPPGPIVGGLRPTPATPQPTAIKAPETIAKFSSQLANGMTYSSPGGGVRTFTMGTPGQDGYGTMTAHGRTGPANDQLGIRQPTAQQPPSAYSFEGSAADAARFNAPVGSPGSNGGWRPASNEAAAFREVQAQRAQEQEGPPKYMTKEEGAASGLGWQMRQEKYQQDMAAYNARNNNQTQMDVATTREQGVSRDSLLRSQEANATNDINRQQLGLNKEKQERDAQGALVDLEGKKLGLAASVSANLARDEYLKDPTPANELKYRGALGKFEKEAQFGTVGTFNDLGEKTGERLYNKQTGDIKESGGTAQEAPPAAIEYLKKNPKGKADFKKKYGYLPSGI